LIQAVPPQATSWQIYPQAHDLVFALGHAYALQHVVDYPDYLADVVWADASTASEAEARELFDQELRIPRETRRAAYLGRRRRCPLRTPESNPSTTRMRTEVGLRGLPTPSSAATRRRRGRVTACITMARCSLVSVIPRRIG